jgi:hypothetical protein
MKFKDKSFDKKIIKDSRITMDAKHSLTLSKITREQNNIQILNKQLNGLEEKLEKEPDINNQNMIKNDINDITKRIKILNLKYNREDYYLNNGDLLFKYYNLQSSTAEATTEDTNTIMKFFNITGSDDKSSDKPVELEPESEIDYTTGSKDDSDNIETFDKINIINKYMSQIDDNFINENYQDNEIENCKICNNCMNINIQDGCVTCDRCGNTEKILLNTEKPSYKDPPREICYFAYKRINHFNEWLAQFQAKESTEIPDNVFTLISNELKKEKNLNIQNITTSTIRIILKKLSLNKYYEHVPHIINMINGQPAPMINRATEEKLRMMFKEIQTPFMKHCPTERKNFLSYSYVLHKFVELLDLDEYLKCFPLLKSREKLQQQDMIWKKICKELKWQYIPSI